MALKPITLRLDEEEYDKLKAHLEAFGAPDINVAYSSRPISAGHDGRFPTQNMAK